MNTLETQGSFLPPFEGTVTGRAWAEFLGRIVEHPELHARWLNTLSLLEHMGSRKIVKALNSYALDETLLRHIAEEARHAHFFKRLSLRVAPALCETYSPDELFGGDASRHYFQSLDKATTSYLSEHNTNLRDGAGAQPTLTYLCVTALIEIRAMQLYPLYERILRHGHHSISLRSVITEEGRHMNEMWKAFRRVGFSWPDHAPALHALEEPLFTAWIDDLRRLLESPSQNRDSLRDHRLPMQ